MTTVYRCFDSENNLIYVGMSEFVLNRCVAHKNLGIWWPKVSRITLFHYKTKAEASKAECNAIRFELPEINQRRNRKSLINRSKPMAKTSKIKPLTKHEIADRIARNVNFWVLTNGERKLALAAAGFAGCKIKTRASFSPMAGFDIHFLKGPK